MHASAKIFIFFFHGLKKSCIFAHDLGSEIPMIFIEALCFLVLENVGTFQGELSRMYDGFTRMAWAVTTLDNSGFRRPSSTMWTYSATLLYCQCSFGTKSPKIMIMDERVKKYIEEQKRLMEEQSSLEKEAKDAYELEKKKKILIKAGLCDKVYMPSISADWGEYPHVDNHIGKRYKLEPWDVSDEDYTELLKYIPEENKQSIKKESIEPDGNKNDDLAINPHAEKILDGVSTIVLVGGIVVFIVYFILSFREEGGYYRSKTVFDWTLFLTGCTSLLIAVSMYAIMQVLRNISINNFNKKKL